ncbi:hypothetical protein V5799_005719 [Amblyomma americanum]|uniref:Uncharacterized protein n=1 Tax=Amblyomma americanum TaxID=6943 RepID=A0AAQ4DYF9_AMBAM
MPVTVFHAALYVDRPDEFNPASLPNNLLTSIRNELLNGARAEIAAAESVFRNGMVSISVPLGNTWLLVGHGYPSHLAVKVDYSQTKDILETLKNTLHAITDTWFSVVSVVIKKQGFRATVRNNETLGQHLCGEGWRLSVMFTGKTDYKSHITLGMLRANNGNRVLDAKIVEANDNCPESIEPCFSSQQESVGGVNAYGLAGEVEALKWAHAMSYYNSVAAEIPNNPFTEALETVDQARKVLSPTFVRDVWGEHVLRRKIEPIIVRVLGLSNANNTGLNVVHLEGVRSDVMDFLRTPNYTSQL